MATILIAIWSNNHRIDDLRSDLNKRIDDLRSDVIRQIQTLDSSLKEFIRSEVRRLEERIERLERPVLRG